MSTMYLPRGYQAQDRNLSLDANRQKDSYWSPQRIEASGRYQWHVYHWAARLIRRHGLRSVLDVGCGTGLKLASLIAPVCGDIEGIDQASAVAVAEKAGVPATMRVADLEDPGLSAWRRFDMVICADVIEHLLDPEPVLRLIRASSHGMGGEEGGGRGGTLVLISTPERCRTRGRGCNVSLKPEHVREWSGREFPRYLASQGLTVIRQRLMPKDDTPQRRHLLGELKYRLRLADRSGLGCQALLCRVAGG